MSDWGGDVAVTSLTGVNQLSDLITGAANGGGPGGGVITDKITKYFREAVETRSEEYGWAFERYPSQGIALLNVPSFGSRESFQFVLNTLTGAWCVFKNLDIVSMENSNAGFYIGTSDGRVLELSSNYTTDNIPVDAATGALADTIKYNLLTHYTHFGSPAEWKRGMFIRPIFIGDSRPSYNCILRYDFDLRPPPYGIPFLTFESAKWDDAVWNTDKWGGSAQNYNTLGGLQGMGRHVAIAMNGEASSNLGLIGFDLMYDTGGML